MKAQANEKAKTNGKSDGNPQLDSLLAASRNELGDNDWQFLNRVYQQPPQTYENRLKAIGFTGRNRILDAGCGFGQWSMALAGLNETVTGIDPVAERIRMATNIAATLDHSNASFKQSRLEKLPFADDSFDAIFCYGVVFLTDVEQSLREFYRTLAPGGRLYVNANGLGWYVHLWLNSPNKASDHDPRQTVVNAFDNTLKVRNGQPKRKGHVILEKKELQESFSDIGFERIQIADEGTINVTLKTTNPVPIKPFFKGEYEGLPGVFEALAHKPTET